MSIPSTESVRVVKAFAAKDATMTADANGKLCCYPSVTGVLDLYDDVIFPGAFRKCLTAFLRRGFNPTDHSWSWVEMVGFPTVAYETGNKLYSEFTFHSTANAQDARIKCKERLDANMEVGLSVGFSMLPSQYIRFATGKELLVYAKKQGYDLSLFDVKGITAHDAPCAAILEIEDLWEYSLTPVPANQAAMAVSVKSAAKGGHTVYLSTNDISPQNSPQNIPQTIHGRSSRSTSTLAATRENLMKTRLKTICGARDLPLAPLDTKWDAAKAMQRVKALTESDEAPTLAFAKAFSVLKGANDEFGSYLFPIADVIEGALMVVPKAVFAAAAALNGARGGVDLSDQERESAKSFLDGYYLKMSAAFHDPEIAAPWTLSAEAGAAMFKGQFLGKYVEYHMCMGALQESAYALHSEIADAMLGYGDYADMSADDKTDAIGQMHDEHKDLNMAVTHAILTGTGAETPEEAADSAKRFLTSTLSTVGLGSGLSFEKHAGAAADAARLFAQRSEERIGARLKDGRELSDANRKTLKALHDSLVETVATLEGLLARTENKTAAQDAEFRMLELRALELQSQNLLARHA